MFVQAGTLSNRKRVLLSDSRNVGKKCKCFKNEICLTSRRGGSGGASLLSTSLKGGCSEADLFYRACSEKARGNGLKLKQERFRSVIGKNLSL